MNDRDLNIEVYTDLVSVNKHMIITHLPTGIRVDGKGISTHKLRKRLILDLEAKFGQKKARY